VALKFLPVAASRDARSLARFHGEVRLARQITHPNVCRVYDIGEVDDTVYISMEYWLSSACRRP
jgi:serine/threonine protein kinase